MFKMRPANLIEELIGEPLNPWSKMMFDNMASNLVMKEMKKRQSGKMSDDLSSKFEQEDTEAEMKRKQLLAIEDIQ